MIVQNHVILDNSRPEPDLALLLPREDFYSESAPSVAEILLLIEVSDSSLTIDRTTKFSLYAESGVREYWIVNLIDRCVEVYRDPQQNGTYSDTRVLHSGETLSISLCRVSPLPSIRCSPHVATADKGRSLRSSNLGIETQIPMPATGSARRDGS